MFLFLSFLAVLLVCAGVFDRWRRRLYVAPVTADKVPPVSRPKHVVLTEAFKPASGEIEVTTIRAEEEHLRTDPEGLVSTLCGDYTSTCDDSSSSCGGSHEC